MIATGLTFATKRNFFLLISTIALGSAYGQDVPWEFAQDKEGIEVYTRQPGGSKFKEFKGITEIKLSLHSAVALLTDVNTMPEWVSDCESTKLIEKKENKVIYHMVIGVPFPFDDRDMVQELTFIYDKETRNMEINLGQNDEIMDPLRGVVRMPVSVGKWTFEHLGKEKYRVTFEYLSDPGGALPAWLVNPFLIRMPYKTLLNFKERVNYPQYKSAYFDWLGATK